MSIILITAYIYNYFSKFRYFKVIGATTVGFAGETHHDGNFSNCRLKIRMKRPAKQLVIDELWIEERLYKIRITDEENQSVENGFTEKQVIYIDVDSEISYSEEQQLPPENLKSKIFLGFRVGDKRKYIPINYAIEELPRLSVA